MATDSEIIGAFAANAADIVRLEAALAAKDAEIERLGKLSDYNIDQFNRAFEAHQAAEAEVARACALLGTRAMDPPDGGDPTLSERIGNALAAKDAEIERLRRDLGLAAQHAAAADAECERRIAAHQAAEVEIERLKGINELQADLLNGAIKRARDERERCARVAEAHRHQQWRDDEVAESVKTQVADAIRAG